MGDKSPKSRDKAAKHSAKKKKDNKSSRDKKQPSTIPAPAGGKK